MLPHLSGKFNTEASKKSWDERPPWSDSLSAARALVIWKGRVLIGVRRSGEALEWRVILVRKDIVEGGGICLFSPWVSLW